MLEGWRDVAAAGGGAGGAGRLSRGTGGTGGTGRRRCREPWLPGPATHTSPVSPPSTSTLPTKSTFTVESR